MTTRTFTHDVDGCWYGRHALRRPGGDNVQRDVLHVIPPRYRIARGINPTRFNPDYIGVHRTVDEHAASDIARYGAEVYVAVIK